MNNQTQEALGILQEECAEVIVEVSKIRRFGLDSVHYKSEMQHTHHLFPFQAWFYVYVAF